MSLRIGARLATRAVFRPINSNGSVALRRGMASNASGQKSLLENDTAWMVCRNVLITRAVLVLRFVLWTGVIWCCVWLFGKLVWNQIPYSNLLLTGNIISIFLHLEALLRSQD
jgi:hypothetical protein